MVNKAVGKFNGSIEKTLMRTAILQAEKMSGNILVIENTPHIRKELVFTLAEAGFTIGAVPDFAAAILRLREFKADMVIIDDMLPNIDCTDACRKIRTSLDIPVALLGENDEESWERAIRAEVNLYEPKPFNYPILAARVKATLRRYHARRFFNINHLLDALERDLPLERDLKATEQTGEG
jgi:DNA-binding response OmpR family regulator